MAVVAGLMLGCTTRVSVPLTDHSTRSSQHSEYVVRAGDTLYTIAWITRADPNDLADWNLLAEPYLLQPGQRLALHDTGRRRPRKAATGSSRAKPRVADKPKRTTQRTKAGARRERAALGPWVWPSSGKVVSRFAPRSGQQGIDIAGSRGSDVVSVASGRVVYAGTGLRGYGRLVIIKHGENHLTAYGNNQKLLVAEREQVSAGQRIATMGDADNGRTLLHFEVRHHGKPIDPIQVLPALN